MKKVIRYKNKIISVILVAALLICNCYIPVAADSQGPSSNTITVYISVEKSVFNSDKEPIVYPTKITINNGSTAYDALGKSSKL